MQKRWDVVGDLRFKSNDSKFKIEDVITLLLENRGLTTKKDIEAFLHPKLEDVTPKSVDISLHQLKKALDRIKIAMKKKEKIIIFGDYDVDGITASAILWETLYALGANVTPYIPHRKEEGYGLSKKGISNLQASNLKVSLIITVDNGIVANEAVDFANDQGIDVIITDHHTVSDMIPNAYAIVHTTKLCGAGIAYLLSQEIKTNVIPLKVGISGSRIPTRVLASVTEASKSGMTDGDGKNEDSHLELAALGTVADLVPLTGANRAIVAEGLKKLQKTKRIGLIALFQQAKIVQDSMGVYEIGYIIGPRLNASGRIESAMDSLRLLCTTNKQRAGELAAKLELVNRKRQQLLKDAAEHAIAGIKNNELGIKKILVLGHASYEEGVIGLVAGKLVEAFYRPAIVLSLGEKVSKASVRSISGFNIIEFLRLHTEYFVNVGGHPMAAGFTIETAKIADLQKALEEKAEELVKDELLKRSLKIDCEVPFEILTQELYNDIQQLAPFGMANFEPVFASIGVTIDGMRILGKDSKHLKLVLKQSFDSRSGQKNSKNFEAIAFGMGELANSLKIGDKIDVAYCLDENTWNGETKLQLKVRDISKNIIGEH